MAASFRKSHHRFSARVSESLMKITVNWGVGIAAVYAVFAASTTAFVVFAMKQPVDLVSPDYYAQALKQDAHTDAVMRAAELGSRVSVTLGERRHLRIQMPADIGGE